MDVTIDTVTNRAPTWWNDPYMHCVRIAYQPVCIINDCSLISRGKISLIFVGVNYKLFKLYPSDQSMIITNAHCVQLPNSYIIILSVSVKCVINVMVGSYIQYLRLSSI